MRAVISAGSNMEDSRAHLRSVVEEFAADLVAASPVYATAPWGGVEQPDFLNQTLLIDAPGTPRDLLARCQRLEREANRVRDVRWGPRTLDVDIIDIEGVTSDDPELTLPHPRAGERAFVLIPWLDVDPEARLGGEKVAGIVEKRREEFAAQGVRRL
ncbi:2-amino-4-hydroxy-6-hydroxymethyldihydropteridine diphosphokinase [Corynebacterium sp. UBA2622]|uniref:2-amino-4-hydroxy-6- hydroxymethyldihydropteridine diphosphokinase n=1 Tax=Corynebacterium sp. UBA2622 TaxID=1946393 RepID=UPI0025B85BE0|nr:2-amino-4-hydroxy-6-hydroxymethyldihydropteridine diphosphokinase [Corynebacterium sp. UBA2622]